MLIPGVVIIWLIGLSHALHLSARFSENGLEGEVVFVQDKGSDLVFIHTDVIYYGTDNDFNWEWSIMQFPVDYTQIKERCIDKKLGSLLVKLDSVVGPLTVNGSADLSGPVSVIPLIGRQGIWGRSLLLKSTMGKTTCATLAPAGNTSLKVAEARFNGPISGSVFFEWVGSSRTDGTDALIYTDLYHTKPRTPITQHNWKIFTTDILDSESDKSRRDCDFLQVVYSPNSNGSGELSGRLGLVSIGAKEMFRDPDLLLPDLNNKQRNLYLVVFDSRHPEHYLVCSRLIQLQPVSLKAIIQSYGLKGNITLEQMSPFSPTKVSLNWTQSGDNKEVIGGFRIHQMPAIPPVSRVPKLMPCYGVGGVYNPEQHPVGADALIPSKFIIV